MPEPRLTTSEEFYLWVGYCITAWANVEERLFGICAKALGAPKERVSVVYYRTPSLDARLSLTGDLVRSALPNPEREDGGHPHPDAKEWADAEAVVRSLLRVRGRIAHHPVADNTLFGQLGADLADGSWIEIYASRNERLRGKDKKASPLGLKDLQEHYRQVREAALRLGRFASDVLPRHTG